MWKCRTTINKLEHNAHKYKMRFARVNPKNTIKNKSMYFYKKYT